MRTGSAGMQSHDPMPKQHRQQDHQTDGSTDENQLVQRIAAAQHFDHGIHDRDAEHGQQQIKNSFEVQDDYL